jgi:ElaB/YqjD/DUF883 family membrane-anchored ribosome-binding protein
VDANDETVGNFMDEHQNPEETVQSGKGHLKTAAGDLKEAASSKVEEIRQAAEQKADELQSAAQGKAQELKGAAENALTDVKSKAETWQTEGEAYIRENPTKAVLIALSIGVLLGFLLRK